MIESPYVVYNQNCGPYPTGSMVTVTSDSRTITLHLIRTAMLAFLDGKSVVFASQLTHREVANLVLQHLSGRMSSNAARWARFLEIGHKKGGVWTTHTGDVDLSELDESTDLLCVRYHCPDVSGKYTWLSVQSGAQALSDWAMATNTTAVVGVPCGYLRAFMDCASVVFDVEPSLDLAVRVLKNAYRGLIGPFRPWSKPLTAWAMSLKENPLCTDE